MDSALPVPLTRNDQEVKVTNREDEPKDMHVIPIHRTPKPSFEQKVQVLNRISKNRSNKKGNQIK
jgi:hypothetical protein